MARKPKKVKDKILVARIDEDMEAKVIDYTEAADMLMGDLVRKAVREYMLNHPVAADNL